MPGLKHSGGARDEDRNDGFAELNLAALVPQFPEVSFHTTAELAPRTFAGLQWRARNAVRELLTRPYRQLLILCGCEGTDQLLVAADLVKEVSKITPRLFRAPGRAQFFLTGQESLFGSGGCVILNAAVLTSHPKWLPQFEASLTAQRALKVILCGDATELEVLNALWPHGEKALYTDIVSYFPSESGPELLGGLMASWASRYQLPAFSDDAVKLLCLYACRLSGDRRWLKLSVARILNLVREAAAMSSGRSASLRSVLKAIAAEDFRLNFPGKNELRDYRDQQIFIDTKGRAIGQINGLSVVETAGTLYEYGDPVRVTAAVRAGGDGEVLDIERKAELAGEIHAKATMIASGYLARVFGSSQPLPVSVSLAFEQSYSEVDGDSASLAALCAVLSALSSLPARQDLAVTGAVDQCGNVLPVGGLNEKIEGFYRICRLQGFSGTQGVIIPEVCAPQLVLRPAVLNAVRNGNFHIYTVRTVASALSLLTGCDWGDCETENTICWHIAARLASTGTGREQKSWWRIWQH